MSHAKDLRPAPRVIYSYPSVHRDYSRHHRSARIRRRNRRRLITVVLSLLVLLVAGLFAQAAFAHEAQAVCPKSPGTGCAVLVVSALAGWTALQLFLWQVFGRGGES